MNCNIRIVCLKFSFDAPNNIRVTVPDGQSQNNIPELLAMDKKIANLYTVNL